MTTREWDIHEVAARRAAGEQLKDIAADYGLKRRRASQLYWQAVRDGVIRPLDAESEPALVQEVREGHMVLVADGPLTNRVRTLQDLIEHFEVDEAIWQPHDWEAKKYEQASKDADGVVQIAEMFSVRSKFQKRPGIEDDLELRDRLLAMLDEHAPSYQPPSWAGDPPPGDYMLELNVSDLHLGMYASAAESGERYDLDTASGLYIAAVERLLGRATQTYSLREIVVPVGNDLMHIDRSDHGPTTTKGTPQDVAARWPEIFESAERTVIEVLDRCRLVAPVRVVVVPGNHDKHSAFTLGRVLAAHYRLDDAVTVEGGREPYACHQFGNVLLGYCHGDSVKWDNLPLIMATEWPELWAESVYREWRIGHQHRKRQGLSLVIDEERAVRVTVMPALTACDAWHLGQGYRHRRAAEGYIWHERDGLDAMLNAPAAALMAASEEAA